MNKNLVFIALFSIRLAIHAESYQLEGIPFEPATNVEVVWTTTATNLPQYLWVYKVIPQTFSMAGVSNLLTLCELESKDFLKRPNPLIPDKDLVRFQTQTIGGRTLHSLEIAPNLGWIHYQNTSENTVKYETAPSNERITDLAFNILFQIGIDRSLILPTAKNYSFATTQVDNNPEIISSRSVFLVRKIDGINERGFCFMADYGNHNKEPMLLSFDLNWRNLTSYESGKVATINEMSDFIKNGKCYMPEQSIDLDMLKRAKKLTVTTFFPLYYNQLGFKKVDFEYPYAVMDIVADMGDNKTISFALNCPILSTK